MVISYIAVRQVVDGWAMGLPIGYGSAVMGLRTFLAWSEAPRVCTLHARNDDKGPSSTVLIGHSVPGPMQGTTGADST